MRLLLQFRRKFGIAARLQSAGVGEKGSVGAKRSSQALASQAGRVESAWNTSADLNFTFEIRLSGIYSAAGSLNRSRLP